jgi:hypothetical protein
MKDRPGASSSNEGPSLLERLPSVDFPSRLIKLERLASFDQKQGKHVVSFAADSPLRGLKSEATLMYTRRDWHVR